MTTTPAAKTLSDRERTDWLRLIRSENVGPRTFHRLIERYGSATDALRALPRLAGRGGQTAVRLCSEAAAARELAQLASLGGRLIASIEPDYPERLRAIEDAPPVLSVLGDALLLARPTVAIVGSRNASLNGLKLARDLARGLGEAGLVVVSGLARGIDGAAHHGALATGTVAVLAGGVDVVYPKEHEPLYRRIAGTGGAVVAEMPFGMGPQARHFPRRNRLISGLALGVVVVEASLHSGSLITARLALEQGREVFAVPGSPLDPRARGGNDLIRQGATLVEGVEHIVTGLQGMLGVAAPLAAPTIPPPAPGPAAVPMPAAEPEPPADREGQRVRIEQLLSPAPIPVDEILRICHLPAATVHSILLEAELAGRLERLPGNRVALVSPGAGG
jgi:DNA processing protein